MIERDGKSIRLLDDLNLLNVALTGNPVNPNASMTSVMAKSLEFMKDKESKSDPNDINLLEIKGQVDKLNAELCSIKKHMGCKNMTEKKDESPEPEAGAPEGQPEEGSQVEGKEAKAEEEGSDAGVEGDSASSESSPEPEGKVSR